MEAILRRVLALLRRLFHTSLRAILSLLSLFSQAAKKQSATKPHNKSTTHDAFLYPRVDEYPPVTVFMAASRMPSSLHPYLQPGPSASRSSQDITTLPINQDSYSLHSLSIQNLPGTSGNGVPLSIRDATTSRPASYLPSARSSIDFHFSPATESPAQSRAPSIYDAADAVEPVPTLLNEAHPRIVTGTPETFNRYSRRIYVADKPTHFDIEPLTIGGKANNPSDDWQTCSHPEGAPYFFHSKNRVFTDVNLFDKSLLVFIDETMKTILDFLRVHNVQLDDNVDLVLDEYLFSDSSQGCQYYFVNHNSRCIFWMDYASSDLFSASHELMGISTASHIRHVLEEQYWYHCELFPLSLRVTHDIVDELRDIVLHSLGDLITSSTSTVSRKVEELDRMVKLIEGITKNVEKGNDQKLSGTSCIVGRLMHEFAHDRVFNFHGEPAARLGVYNSVYDTQRHRTPLIRMLSPLLFYAPDFHLDGLHTIYTDGLVRNRGWSEFVTRLTSEWQEFTLYATVVLNANVAFLSIQSVDTNGTATPHRSSTQISSYMSMLTSIGAIIIGLLLLKQNRNRDRGTAPDAALYMFNRTHPTLGLETLAVLYSLPYAMLIWSMVSFLAAFSFMCFEDADLKTRTLTAVLWVVVSALILWCAVNGWENGLVDWDWRWMLGIFRAKQEEDREEKSVQDADDEVTSVASHTKPSKRRWWPPVTLRGRSMDSDKTVV
ncbi:hypothetical protein C8F01DRAFT_1116136 [Mycena amicta]|nr:hypothetical protein C8F01DRAFT_1116136 [Mycena amicta]